MSIVAFSGPLITFQDGGLLNSSSANQNPDAAPSLFNMASGLLDTRTPLAFYPDDPNGLIGIGAAGVPVYAAPAFGWLNAQFIVADYAPATASTVSIAPGQALSTTSLTFVTTSSIGATTNSGPGVVVPNAAGTLTPTTGCVLIDKAPSWVFPGQAQSVALWDPANPPVGRAVSIYTNGTASTINFTVNGYDAYGYPITQVIAGFAGTGSVTTGKAFKWVSSVTIPAASTSSTISASVGISDTYGLPMFCGSFSYLDLWFNNIPAFSTSSTAFVAGTTATTTTSTDVRGTYNIALSGGLGGASNGAKTLQIWQFVSVANISTAAGCWGVTPA